MKRQALLLCIPLLLVSVIVLLVQRHLHNAELEVQVRKVTDLEAEKTSTCRQLADFLGQQADTAAKEPAHSNEIRLRWAGTMAWVEFCSTEKQIIRDLVIELGRDEHADVPDMLRKIRSRLNWSATARQPNVQ